MMIPLGLKNLGNTCYINSILQSLHSLEIFQTTILTMNHQHICSHPSTCLLSLLEATLSLLEVDDIDVHNNNDNPNSSNLIELKSKRYNQQKMYYTSPSQLVSCIPIEVSNQFQLGFQQDAHEFLNELIYALNRCKENNLINNSLQLLFRSQVINCIECLECHNKSINKDMIQGIDLCINKSSTLEAAIDNYFGMEELKDENAYYCEKCFKKTKANKYFRLDENIPNILTFQVCFHISLLDMNILILILTLYELSYS